MPEAFSPENFIIQIPELSVEMFQSVVMALIYGFVLSVIIRKTEMMESDRPKKRIYATILDNQQMHVVLCVCGAFIMILIGKSLANALGLVGALSIIRFRTDLISPQEGANIIVVLTVGMACGLELYALALFMTILIGTLIWLLARYRTKQKKEYFAQRDAEKAQRQADIQENNPSSVSSVASHSTPIPESKKIQEM